MGFGSRVVVVVVVVVAEGLLLVESAARFSFSRFVVVVRCSITVVVWESAMPWPASGLSATGLVWRVASRSLVEEVLCRLLSCLDSKTNSVLACCARPGASEHTLRGLTGVLVDPVAFCVDR